MHVLFLILSALLTSPAMARDRITIAMVGVHQELLMKDAQYSASEQFSDTIKGLGKFDPLGPRDVAWLIQGREEVILQDAFATRGRRLLEDGKTLYAQAQIEESIPVLQAAAKAFETSMAAANVTKDLWQALFVLGTAQQTMGEIDAAKEFWTQAITLSPERSPNAAQYPPQIIQTYKSIQKTHLERRASLQVTSDQPEISVWLNGELVGQTPLKIDDVALGSNHIMGRNKAGQIAYQRVVATAENPATVALNLSQAGWGVPATSNRARVVQTSDLYRALGDHAEVDLILVMGEIGSEVSLQLYSPRMDSFSRPLMKPVTGSATDEIINALPELLQTATPDGALLSMAITPEAAALDVSANQMLAQLLLAPAEITASSPSKLKWWHLAIAGGGALTIGGVVTGVVVGSDQAEAPHQGTIVIGPIP